MPLGIDLKVLIGRNKPAPASFELMEALQSVEVTHSDQGKSGFQMTFSVGRAGAIDLRDYQLIVNPLLTPYNRVILIVIINARAEILMDGIITHQQLSPGMQVGSSTFTVTGEDISVMMDLEQKSVSHPEQQDEQIITKILSDSKYANYQLIPDVNSAPIKDRPTKQERIKTQQGTDLQYIQSLASRYDFVFYITPGPGVEQNTAYWGKPLRKKSFLPPLTVNMGSYTNVESINFQHDTLTASTVVGQVQDRKGNTIASVKFESSDREDLSNRPALKNQAFKRTTIFRETARLTLQAQAHAQAMVNNSVEKVVTASGELDTIRYGAILGLRGIVGLRGVGYTYDGFYYVKSVTHKLKKGEYKQSFTMTREGLETTTKQLQMGAGG
ncbi:hypothetical protein NIES2100_46740 [Calothrix sp. NIES-2100]|uniref:phage late control D family protein n=1 Tax=Calothrix sp. NIES-2100 TaxID=1954172 RepID=UPI000B5E185E|nr:hypothetical protein NIES2100_46740 [Calothrix sp. NIES-2100]